MGEMSLLEWAVSYIRYKDSIKQKVKNINEDVANKRVIVVNKDDSSEIYVCAERLDDLSASSLSDEKVVCLNKKDNVSWLINNWDVVKDTRCVFLFVNVKKSESWAINPRMHHSITDKSALKPGLKVLFESISSAD